MVEAQDCGSARPAVPVHGDGEELMGTNYYVKTEACPHCGRGAETLHIGKSSGGWRFFFAAYPERDLMSWKSWRALLAKPDSIIVDEYGREVPLTDLDARIAGHAGLRRGDDPDGHTDPEGHPFSRSADFS